MKAMKIKTVIASLAAVTLLTACGGSKGETAQDSTPAVDEAAFAESQPMQSGVYDASRYDITGENERKGAFDGRVMAALDPQLSALYIYENGNRTKIDYKVVMEKPFEKGDSAYATVDIKGNPVTINTDSTVYVLTFTKGKELVKIEFDSKARTTATATEMQERINEQSHK